MIIDEETALHRQLSEAYAALQRAENEAYHARQWAKSWKRIATIRNRELSELQAERLTLRGFVRALWRSYAETRKP